MRINLGTVDIKSDDWDLIKEYFTRDEAKEYMLEIAVMCLRNEALGRYSVDEDKNR